ncbi:uncharacterized protein LOC135236266 [Anguilla rostrata]|uniref:uncharacterized protein LOC135236266 n=1 Tax=Anguilla rostrata TaxID=7938 RepID=UPI0030D601CA
MTVIKQTSVLHRNPQSPQNNSGGGGGEGPGQEVQTIVPVPLKSPLFSLLSNRAPEEAAPCPRTRDQATPHLRLDGLPRPLSTGAAPFAPRHPAHRVHSEPMEGRQICHLLWCVLLLLGASINVWASDQASVTKTTDPTPKVTNGTKEADSSTATTKPSHNTTNTAETPGPDCLSETNNWGSNFPWAKWEAMVAMGLAGLAFAFVVSTVTLALRVRQLKRQVGGSRPSRSNVDLVSGMGYPSASRGGSRSGSREAVGDGHADAGVRMEEVRQTEETGGVGRGESGNGEASRDGSAQTGTASQSVASPAGSSKEDVEVLVVV